METATPVEPIVVKVVTNEQYFGEPSVIRTILERLVPPLVGQPANEILFIHRKDPAAVASIDITIFEEGSEPIRRLIAHFVTMLMDMPRHIQLTYVVTFTTMRDDVAELDTFDAMTASLEAEQALKRYLGVIENRTMREHAAQASNEAREEEMLWDLLMSQPFPSIGMSEQARAEGNFVVDSLMPIVDRWFNQ